MSFMKRPLVKEVPDYFRNKENWIPIWESKTANLRIDRLLHTHINRLVHTNVKPYYSWKSDERVDVIITYAMSKTTEGNLLSQYLNSQPNQQETKEAVFSQWFEDDPGYDYLVPKGARL